MCVGELRGRYSELMDGTALLSDCMFADHTLPLCVHVFLIIKYLVIKHFLQIIIFQLVTNLTKSWE